MDRKSRDTPYVQKRVQARKAASDSGSVTASGTSGDSESASLINQADEASGNLVDDSDGNASGGESEQSSAHQFDKSPINEAATISFGALAKAQAILGKRKRGNTDDGDDGETSKRDINENDKFINSEALERRAGKKDTRGFLRSSKHAPAEVSSKKAVSRKREVVPIQKIDHRDPRFEPLSGPLDEQKTKKKYAFLDMYRDDEIGELKSTIHKTKDPGAKEKLKRALLSMESRKKSQQAKEQQQEILRRHRKEERAKIEHGKKPFYLKKADQKQLALVERFEGMKAKQVDKVIERRRKKQAGKERKAMPDARRG